MYPAPNVIIKLDIMYYFLANLAHNKTIIVIIYCFKVSTVKVLKIFIGINLIALKNYRNYL